MFYNNRDVYNFFDTVPDSFLGWMKTYYRVTLFTLACIVFTLVMALIKYVYLNNL